MKRLVPKFPPPPVLDDRLIEEVGNLCFFETLPERSDILITFGTSVGAAAAARQTLSTLRTTGARILVLTGGYAGAHAGFTEVADGLSEAQGIYRLMAGETGGADLIAETDFVVFEKRSANTKENVERVRSRLNVGDEDRIAFVAHGYASRRSYLTLRAAFPKNAIIAAHYEIELRTDPDTCIRLTREDWFKSEVSRALVWGEVLRIDLYRSLGDLVGDGILAGLDRIKTLTGRAPFLQAAPGRLEA